MQLKKEHAGTLLAFCTAIISGFSIFANKVFIVNLDPTVFTASRAIMIGTLFLVLSLVSIRFDFGKLKGLPWKYLLAIAIVGGSFAFLLFFNGLKLTTASRAGFLHKTLPIYATVFAYVFLKERIGKLQLCALLVMLAGLALLSFSTVAPAELWANPAQGDMLILAATIMWAAENVIAKKAMLSKVSHLIVVFSRMFFGGLILLGVVLLMGKAELLLMLTGPQAANIAISTLLLTGFVATYYWSLRYINVSKAATMLLLAPVITMALGVGILGEPAPMLQVIGCALILAGGIAISKVRSEVAAV